MAYVTAGTMNFSRSIAIVGVLVNLMGLIVLSQPALRRQSTFVYLKVLAVTDTMVLIVNVIIQIHVIRGPRVQLPVAYILFFQMLQQASSWILIAVTAERYIIVKHPLRARTMCNMKKAFIYILSYIVPSLIFISTNIIIISYMEQRGNMQSILTNVTLGHGQDTVRRKADHRHARSYYCHFYSACIAASNL